MKLQNFSSALAFLLFFFFSSSVLAQPSGVLKAGLNYSSWYGESSDGTSGKIGFHAGGQMQLKIGSGEFLQPEIEYSSEGAKASDENLAISLHYLKFSLTLRGTQSYGPGLFYDLGVFYSHLLNAKGKVDNVSGDITKFFKSADFGVLGGLGYQSPSNIGFFIRYNLGITNVFKNSDAEIANNGFQFSLFYNFSKSEKQ